MPDPRVGVGKSANDILIDRAIRHAVLLERYKNHLDRLAQQTLSSEVVEKLVDNIERRLNRIKSRGHFSRVLKSKGVAELFSTNREILRTGMAQLHKDVQGELFGLSVTEVEWQLAALDSSVPLNLSFTKPSASLIRSAVTSKNIVGKPMREWWKGLENLTQDQIKRQITTGLAAGESVPQMVRRIRGSRASAFSDGVLKTTRAHASSIVRTAVTNVSTDAKEAVFAENSDVIASVRIVATLDSRTTPICMSLDGKIYPIGEGDRPPFHHNCRTATVPVMKTWKEMGINLKEAPAGTRAALGGPVSSKLTYPKWLKKQPEEFQDLALGKGKAKLWREGKVTIDKFVDDRGKTLSLEAVRANEGLN